MLNKYILEGHKAVLEPDLFKWATWFEKADRHVDLTWIENHRVSTVFLGIDHQFLPGRRPILFETMIFAGKDDPLNLYQERCSTWEDAEEMHKIAVQKAKRAVRKKMKPKKKRKSK